MSRGRARPADWQARRAAAEEVGLHVILSAGAGSGKTAALVERYMNILARDPQAEVDNIAAVTFTNRAAREMKERLRGRFRERFDEARGRGELEEMRRWRRRLQRLEMAPISTIHSLCGSILAQYPLAAGVDPHFEVLDDLQEALHLPRVVADSLLSGLEAGRDSAAQVIGYFEGLDSAAEAVVALVRMRERYREWFEKEVTAEQLQEMWEEAEQQWIEQQLQATVGGQRWEELMQELDEAAEIAAELIGDALAERVLAVQEVVQGPIPREAGELVDFIEELRGRAGRWWSSGSAKKWGGEAQRQWARDVVGQVVGAFEALRSILSDCELEPSAATAELAASVWAEARVAVEAWGRFKALVPALDFEDLQVKLLELLRGREDVRRRVQARFRHILVDEFQDTNELQRDVIWALAGMGEKRWPARVFIVGDAKQSIYRFRNADVTVFTRAAREFEQREDCLGLSLTASFRPSQALMEFFNEVFPHDDMLGEEACEDYRVPYVAMEAHRDDTPIEPAALGLLVASEEQDSFGRRLDEARVIARFVAQLLELRPNIYDHGSGRHRPLQPGDIAIIFRAMTEAFLYEDQLAERGLPFYNVAGRGFFGRPEVLDLVNALSAIVNPADEIALVGVLRSPMFAISDNTLVWLSRQRGSWWEKLQAAAQPEARGEEPLRRIEAEEFNRLVAAGKLLASWREVADRLPTAALVNKIVEQTGYSGAMAAQMGGVRAVANIGKLIDLARQFDTAAAGGVAEFVRLVETLAAHDVPEAQAPTEEAEGESIRLTTVHAAKGLQWPVVIVADLCRQSRRRQEVRRTNAHPRWGLVPAEVEHYPPDRYRLLGKIIRELDNAEEDAEDRRLLYVAMTRASDLLVLSSSVKAAEGQVVVEARGWLGRLREACGLPKKMPQPVETEPVAGATLGAWYLIPRPDGELPRLNVPPGEAAGKEDGGRKEAQVGAVDLGPAVDEVHADPGARLRFAVTELADYLDCPEFYRLRHVEALPDMRPAEPAARPGLTALERGTLVHRLLQMVGTGGPEELERLLGEVIPGGGALRVLGNEDLAAVREMVMWFLNTELYRGEVAPARRLRTEARLSVEIDGVLVEGKVDAVAETDDGPVLIDYKTGGGPRAGEDERGPKLDRFQIAVYAWGLNRLLGQWPRRCVIAYLGQRRLETVRLPGAAEEAASEARQAIAAIRAGQFPPRPAADKCSRCRLRWACAAVDDIGT